LNTQEKSIINITYEINTRTRLEDEQTLNFVSSKAVVDSILTRAAKTRGRRKHLYQFNGRMSLRLGQITTIKGRKHICPVKLRAEHR